MKILGGDRAQDIPILRGANIYLFDWRALRRWGFKTRDLPAGSIVLNRPPTLIEAYGRYVFGGLVLIFVQLLLNPAALEPACEGKNNQETPARERSPAS